MGINFIVVVENVLNRTQEEANREFGVVEMGEGKIIPMWKIIEFKGKSYAEWQFTPRYFKKEESPEMWEALRKYLVRVKEFFGGKIYMDNDVVWLGLEEDGYLPYLLDDEELAPPDYEKHPELKDIKELEGLIW
jgi:hypothetical protein